MVHFPSFSIDKMVHFPSFSIVHVWLPEVVMSKKRYSFSGSHELNLQAMHLQRETSLALQEKAYSLALNTPTSFTWVWLKIKDLDDHRFKSLFSIWLVVWNMNFIFPYIGNVITPTDFHIFQRVGYTTNQVLIIQSLGYLLVTHSHGNPKVRCSVSCGRPCGREAAPVALGRCRNALGIGWSSGLKTDMFWHWNVFNFLKGGWSKSDDLEVAFLLKDHVATRISHATSKELNEPIFLGCEMCDNLEESQVLDTQIPDDSSTLLLFSGDSGFSFLLLTIIYPLVNVYIAKLWKIAIEIVDLPIKNSDFS